MSAGRLGIAAGFLPADLRAEATAALLACRVLGAYEDLSDHPRVRARLTLEDYLALVETMPARIIAAEHTYKGVAMNHRFPNGSVTPPERSPYGMSATG